ncbi:MAG: hypothetical protein EZS28_047039 [Streblomastix strix]|uniref:Uncharacterized protein n=1 Tax=Streblomastix strix TaxID=222440 RepID=A0A5J4TG79_9EUKA|nr:MAG: hypothetical protein EZS28_047039 [Streblomastix strix]
MAKRRRLHIEDQIESQIEDQLKLNQEKKGIVEVVSNVQSVAGKDLKVPLNMVKAAISNSVIIHKQEIDGLSPGERRTVRRSAFCTFFRESKKKSQVEYLFNKWFIIK